MTKNKVGVILVALLGIGFVLAGCSNANAEVENVGVNEVKGKTFEFKEGKDNSGTDIPKKVVFGDYYATYYTAELDDDGDVVFDPEREVKSWSKEQRVEYAYDSFTKTLTTRVVDEGKGKPFVYYTYTLDEKGKITEIKEKP